jgi:hypothetical protein
MMPGRDEVGKRVIAIMAAIRATTKQGNESGPQMDGAERRRLAKERDD